MGEFVSQRALAEQEKAYKAKRFEDYMQQVDAGKMTRALAITAFKEELEFNDVQEETAQNSAN